MSGTGDIRPENNRGGVHNHHWHALKGYACQWRLNQRRCVVRPGDGDKNKVSSTEFAGPS
jgi:hypothetical protein